MTRKEAFETAARTVNVWGGGTSWTIQYPYHDDRPDGPKTEASAHSYSLARARAKCIKARVAAALLGLDKEGRSWAEYLAEHYDDWRSAVRRALHEHQPVD